MEDIEDIPTIVDRIVSNSKSTEDETISSETVRVDSPDSNVSPILLDSLLDIHKSETFSSGFLGLREYIAMNGLESLGTTDYLRGKIWKILLGVPFYFEVDTYLHKCEVESFPPFVIFSLRLTLLIRQEATDAFDDKIRNDVFRTFRSDEGFWRKADSEVMTRILRATSVDFGYVQGMNVLLAPFVYVMPELDSYYCFHTLISDHITSYCNKNLSGVHRGIQLVNRCLHVFDPQLHQHILSKIPDLAIFSVRFIMTLMANVQPLSELLLLWDRIFALGVHSAVIFFCAHLMKMRRSILHLNSGYKYVSTT